MSKKISIIIIIILLIITAVVYIGIWNAKKEMSVKQTSQIPIVSTEQPAKSTKVEEAAKPADSDVAGIESDLNSVSDDGFSEDNLSDTEVGL